ncbi:hypothetical protein PFISCL1PPCAC_9388, partial [Pristionchus fissidentatus]
SQLVFRLSMTRIKLEAIIVLQDETLDTIARRQDSESDLSLLIDDSNCSPIAYPLRRFVLRCGEDSSEFVSGKESETIHHHL